MVGIETTKTHAHLLYGWKASLMKAVVLGRVNREEKERLVQEAFEGGLLRQTRAATGYRFTSSITFDKLQVEVTKRERELVLVSVNAVATAAQEDPIAATTAQLNRM